MNFRFLAFLIALTTFVASGHFGLEPAAGQTTTTARRTTAPASPPRTVWGEPNIDGVWSFTTNTPLERPAQFGDREFLTPEEIAEQNKVAESERPLDPGDPGTYNAFWFDRGKSLGRTSLITSPRNGRVPPLTPEARKRQSARGPEGFESWENRGLSERCLTRPTLGPPILHGRT